MGLIRSFEDNDFKNEDLHIMRQNGQRIIALAGNPNVGKSTVFNSLTGLRQHTGNWAGKTVATAQGEYEFEDQKFSMVDLPGTYSLLAHSAEEEIARNFICFGNPDVTVVVVDATCLERNLNLVLQTLEITGSVIVCVNLLDEAKKKHIKIDLEKLQKLLGVPVIGTSARKNAGLYELKIAIKEMSLRKEKPKPLLISYPDILEQCIAILKPYVDEQTDNKINSRWVCLRLLDNDKTLLDTLNDYIGKDIKTDELISALNLSQAKLYGQNIDEDKIRDEIVTSIVNNAENISRETVFIKEEKYNDKDRKIDKLLTSRFTGIPIMILMLGVVFYITIVGANYPSKVLSSILFGFQDNLTDFFTSIGVSPWLRGLFIDGMYKTTAWVVSVMLPPMAIFFPLFTLLEDFGYLPRVAFNLDKYFKRSGACGKQALTMCMGFGCNAAGVVGCRIIDSPRERLIAIITNNFVPCNGRFPTLITILTLFFMGSVYNGIYLTALLLALIVFGVFMTFTVSKILSKTVLKGVPSSFTLELPPYRRPQIGKIIVRSIFDRTLFVLGRAVMVAAPAGMIIWILANTQVYGVSILVHIADFLGPFAYLIGLDGYILLAFLLGFPANEIVMPIVIMSYLATGSLTELTELSALHNLLVANGWTITTALCTMLFSLNHFPCSTTCLTIKKETGSLKWTLISFLTPTIVGIVVCFLVASVSRLIM